MFVQPDSTPSAHPRFGGHHHRTEPHAKHLEVSLSIIGAHRSERQGSAFNALEITHHLCTHLNRSRAASQASFLHTPLTSKTVAERSEGPAFESIAPHRAQSEPIHTMANEFESENE
jgi:hypothetical protein